MKIVDAPPCLAVDTYSHVTYAQAQDLVHAGVRLVMLYAENVTVTDLTACFANGLYVGILIVGLSPSTVPSTALGTTIARRASALCADLAIPPGATFMLDVEGGGHLYSDWVDYAHAANTELVAAGNQSGIYVGEGLGLSSKELYDLPQTRYWKSMSRVVDRTGLIAEPSCGWCMVQQGPADQMIGSLQVDLSVVGQDYHGRTIRVVSS